MVWFRVKGQLLQYQRTVDLCPFVSRDGDLPSTYASLAIEGWTARSRRRRRHLPSSVAFVNPLLALKDSHPRIPYSIEAPGHHLCRVRLLPGKT